MLDSFSQIQDECVMDSSYGGANNQSNKRDTQTLNANQRERKPIPAPSTSEPVHLLKMVSKDGHVDFSNRNELLVPKQLTLATFTQILSINLSKNKIGEVSEAFIKSVPRVEHLDLSQNQLEFVPPAIIKWRYLQTLNLNNNLLRTLPSEVGDLQSLVSL
jgi:Leucine-rich repeat (LRR) protein